MNVRSVAKSTLEQHGSFSELAFVQNPATLRDSLGSLGSLGVGPILLGDMVQVVSWVDGIKVLNFFFECVTHYIFSELSSVVKCRIKVLCGEIVHVLDGGRFKIRPTGFRFSICVPQRLGDSQGERADQVQHLFFRLFYTAVDLLIRIHSASLI